MLTVLYHLPLCVAWLPLGLGGVRRESRRAMGLLLLLGAAQPLLLGVELGLYRYRPPLSPPSPRRFERVGGSNADSGEEGLRHLPPM